MHVLGASGLSRFVQVPENVHCARVDTFDCIGTARQQASASSRLSRAGAVAGSVRQPRIEIDDLGVRVRRAF
jgi:hypothetical protein